MWSRYPSEKRRVLAKIGDRGGSVTRGMVAAYVATVWEKGENGSKGSVRESVRTLKTKELILNNINNQ